jgi:Sec-independent protein translocase protein TatA
MRNISISQLVVVFLVGVLLFSDFSKTVKSLRNLAKHNKFLKKLKKK